MKISPSPVAKSGDGAADTQPSSPAPVDLVAPSGLRELVWLTLLAAAAPGPACSAACTPTGASGWQQLTPDPYGTTYGFFDGHGWNMTFDHTSNRLNGRYDFAGSGFGPLHQEFIYSNWIAPDLTARIVTEYEVLTGLALDRRRIDLLSGVLRLSELAELADDADHAAAMVQTVADGAAR